MSFQSSVFIMLIVNVFLTYDVASASATNVYIAQAAAGTADGSSCTNAKAVSFFNTSGNWGAGSTQIGAGTTVHLCGTVTANLTFQGNGASGNPVVLDGTGATLSAYIDVGTQYWTIQSVTYSTSYGTGSPTQAALQVLGGAAFGTIQGNTIDIGPSSQVIFIAHVSHDLNILNNFMRITAPAGDGYDTDILDTEGSYNVLVQGNYMELAITGDDSCGGCHDDVTQLWASGNNPANAPYNWTLVNNEMVANSPGHNHNLSMIMWEELGAGYFNIYGNLFRCVAGGSIGNGITTDSNVSGTVFTVYANTFVENAGACNNMYNLSGPGNITLSDNITYSTDSGQMLTGSGPVTRSYNLWYGPAAPSCSGLTGEICGKNPLFTNYSGNNFTLQSGSPAIGVGTNLGSTYASHPLPGATWPNPALGMRTGTGTWNIGAFDFPPNPPTNLQSIGR